jgi:peptidoglycan/LPS O-acetylase OafA/YrhL
MSLFFGSPAVAPSLIGYRPEIDGLRALAVAVVVLYHAHLKCPGGYVGVDVFFVISGYLITALLLRDLQAGRFSFLDFWERRLRRIMPALMVMVVVTLGVGGILMLPSDYAQLGKSVVAQALLVANVFFWRDDSTRGGYFGATSEDRPLLHTWSLAVEEQFYLLFPLVLWWLFRFERCRKPAVLTMILAGGVMAGLALAIYGVAFRPGAAFYLLPTRAWELLGGALIAALPVAAYPRHWLMREGASWLGLAGILLPCWLYTKETPFPGLAAVPPVVGAGLFIWGNARIPDGLVALTSAGRIMAWRPIVFIGLISYSLYLWHWPMLVLGQYWRLENFSPWYFRAGLVLASGVFAVLSWRWIETPFRRKRLMATRTAAFRWATACTVVSILLGGAMVHFRGIPARVPEIAFKNDEAKIDFGGNLDDTNLLHVKSGKLWRLGLAGHEATSKILLWGDSHAKHAVPALDALCVELGVSGCAVIYTTSPPLLDTVFPKYSGYGLGEKLPEFTEAVLEYIKQHRIPHVLLAAYWSLYHQPDARLLETSLRSTINALHQVGCQVWILQDVPDVDVMAYKGLAAEAMAGRAFGSAFSNGGWRRRISDHQQKHSVLYSLAAENLPATFIDPAPLLVEHSSDRYRADLNGVSIYHDDDHLTKTASVALLLPLFRQAMAEKLIAAPSGEPVGDK